MGKDKRKHDEVDEDKEDSEEGAIQVRKKVRMNEDLPKVQTGTKDQMQIEVDVPQKTQKAGAGSQKVQLPSLTTSNILQSGNSESQASNNTELQINIVPSGAASE